MITIVLLLIATTIAVRLALVASHRRTARERLGSGSMRRSLAPVLQRVAAPLLRTRADRAVERELPDALDAIARSLRSGSSLRQAIDEAATSVTGALAGDLDRVRRALGNGDPLADALARWSAVRELPGVRLAVAALSLGAETGGASAQAVDGVAATLRTNLAITGEVRALSSQARLSALVIALAPIAFSLLAASSDGTTASFLLGTPLGLACLTLGLGLDGVGWLWMRRITAAVT